MNNKTKDKSVTNAQTLRERAERIDPKPERHHAVEEDEASADSRISGVHADYDRQSDPANFGGYGGGQTGSPVPNAFGRKTTTNVPGPGDSGGTDKPRTADDNDDQDQANRRADKK